MSEKSFTFKIPEESGEIRAVVFKFIVPSETLYDKFENEQRRDLSDARSRLVKACVKSHTGSQLDEIFERFPAVKHGLALAIQKEAGGFLEIIEGEASPS